jgi:hypothetical protein
MLTEKQPVILHTKIRRPWKAPELDVNGKEQWIDTHLLLAMYPDLDDDSEVVSVMSCVTDIRWVPNVRLVWQSTGLGRLTIFAAVSNGRRHNFGEEWTKLSSLNNNRKGSLI